jgi:hypothetical protein
MHHASSTQLLLAESSTTSSPSKLRGDRVFQVCFVTQRDSDPYYPHVVPPADRRNHVWSDSTSSLRTLTTPDL